jgi:hypothetical protein
MRIAALGLIAVSLTAAEAPKPLTNEQKIEIYQMVVDLNAIDQQEREALATVEKQLEVIREKAGKERIVLQDALQKKIESLGADGWTLGPGLVWRPTAGPQSPTPPAATTPSQSAP